MRKTIVIFLIYTFYLNVNGQEHSDIINKYLSSTVTIFLDDNTKSGSGFIIEKGKIITNLHVIEGNKNGYVIINGTDIKHKIDGYFDYDSGTDLAILSVPTLKGTPLSLANEQPKIGDRVFAFENPLISSKIVLEGTINYTSSSMSSGIIKTTIALNYGNSGGALINSKGLVIGVINGAVISEIENFRAGYAIEVSFLKKLLKRKNETKKDLNIVNEAYHYINQFQLKYVVQDYQGALLDLNKSIEANPNLFTSYYNRANLKLKLNDLKGSIEDCNKSLEIIPNFALALNVRGLAKVKLNDNNGAIIDFSKSIEIDNNFASAYGSRGLAKANLKDFDGAIIDLDKAIKIEPKNELFYLTRGGVYLFSGYKEEGCHDFQIAKELGLSDAQILIDKFCNTSKTAKEFFESGVIKQNDKNFEGAIADYNKAIEIDPNLVRVYNNRGNAKSDLKDYKGAILDFSKALEIDPNDNYIYCNRGLAKTKIKDYTGAILDYTKALSIDSKDANSYMGRGITHNYLGNKKNACSDWLKAGELGYERAYIFIKKYCN
jgi:tetratricopeptide (TPR) repeat protein